MSQCPVCSSEIQDSFGLIECPSCHKILFADFDGTLKIHEEESESETPVDENFSVEEVPAETSNFSEDWNEQEEPVQAESVVKAEAAIREAPSAIDEINTFANSEESSLKKGSLIYNLTVKNIDTEDLKQEILEVLKEPKLNIDIQNLKFSLPTLELKDLNPIKVSVIISRIKHLPVDLEWDQRSVHSEGDGND